MEPTLPPALGVTLPARLDLLCGCLAEHAPTFTRGLARGLQQSVKTHVMRSLHELCFFWSLSHFPLSEGGAGLALGSGYLPPLRVSLNISASGEIRQAQSLSWLGVSDAPDGALVCCRSAQVSVSPWLPPGRSRIPKRGLTASSLPGRWGGIPSSCRSVLVPTPPSLSTDLLSSCHCDHVLWAPSSIPAPEAQGPQPWFPGCCPWLPCLPRVSRVSSLLCGCPAPISFHRGETGKERTSDSAESPHWTGPPPTCALGWVSRGVGLDEDTDPCSQGLSCVAQWQTQKPHKETNEPKSPPSTQA